MSDLTITPTRPPTSARRARVLSEAVVSAYLRDIMPPRQRRARSASALASSPTGSSTVPTLPAPRASARGLAATTPAVPWGPPPVAADPRNDRGGPGDAQAIIRGGAPP